MNNDVHQAASSKEMWRETLKLLGGLSGNKIARSLVWWKQRTGLQGIWINQRLDLHFNWNECRFWCLDQDDRWENQWPGKLFDPRVCGWWDSQWSNTENKSPASSALSFNWTWRGPQNLILIWLSSCWENSLKMTIWIGSEGTETSLNVPATITFFAIFILSVTRWGKQRTLSYVLNYLSIYCSFPATAVVSHIVSWYCENWEEYTCLSFVSLLILLRHDKSSTEPESPAG